MDTTPKALENRPDIHPWMHEYLDAFTILGNSRDFGFSANPIRLSEIVAYTKLFGCSDVSLFVTIIQHLDRIYFEHINKDKP